MSSPESSTPDTQSVQRPYASEQPHSQFDVSPAQVALSGLAQHVVHRGITSHFTQKRQTLRFTQEVERTVHNPATGHSEGTRTETNLPVYIPAISRTDKQRLHAKPKKGASKELNSKHAWVTQIAENMTAGNFRAAAGATSHIESEVEEAASTHVSISAKIGNSLLPKSQKRQSYLQRTYADLKRRAFSSAMNAGYPEQETDEDLLKPADSTVENKPWEALVEPQNVQALRVKVADTWLARGGNPALIPAYIRAGGIIDLAPEYVAAYLNVNQQALHRQIKDKNAPAVVSPLVLAKLNYVLQFTENGVRGNRLPQDLCEFIGADPSDSAPTARDTSPVERMYKIDQLAEKHSRQSKDQNQRPGQQAEMQPSRQPENDTWYTTLQFIDRKASDATSETTEHPTVSLDELQRLHTDTQYNNLVRKHGIDKIALLNMSEQDKAELRREAASRAAIVGRKQYENLVAAQIIRGNEGNINKDNLTKAMDEVDNNKNQ